MSLKRPRAHRNTEVFLDVVPIHEVIEEGLEITAAAIAISM